MAKTKRPTVKSALGKLRATYRHLRFVQKKNAELEESVFKLMQKAAYYDRCMHKAVDLMNGNDKGWRELLEQLEAENRRLIAERRQFAIPSLEDDLESWRN